MKIQYASDLHLEFGANWKKRVRLPPFGQVHLTPKNLLFLTP